MCGFFLIHPVPTKPMESPWDVSRLPKTSQPSHLKNDFCKGMDLHKKPTFTPKLFSSELGVGLGVGVKAVKGSWMKWQEIGGHFRVGEAHSCPKLAGSVHGFLKMLI